MRKVLLTLICSVAAPVSLLLGAGPASAAPFGFVGSPSKILFGSPGITQVHFRWRRYAGYYAPNYYSTPPTYYSAPPVVYYPPPPVVYYPPPVVYYPTPAVPYYAPPNAYPSDNGHGDVGYGDGGYGGVGHGDGGYGGVGYGDGGW